MIAGLDLESSEHPETPQGPVEFLDACKLPALQSQKGTSCNNRNRSQICCWKVHGCLTYSPRFPVAVGSTLEPPQSTRRTTARAAGPSHPRHPCAQRGLLAPGVAFQGCVFLGSPVVPRYPSCFGFWVPLQRRRPKTGHPRWATKVFVFRDWCCGFLRLCASVHCQASCRRRFAGISKTGSCHLFIEAWKMQAGGNKIAVSLEASALRCHEP